MIQVNEQNIHEVINGFEMRLLSVENRLHMFETAYQHLQKGDLVAAAQEVIAYYAAQSAEELDMIKQQIGQLRDIQAKLKSNIIVPGGPLAPNSVLSR